MKYTKSIIAFSILNFFLIFSVIYIANKTREIEKENNELKIKISKINTNIKINEVELITHQNSSYLKKLYSLYFSEKINYHSPNLLTINQISIKDKNLKYVKSNN